MYRARVGEGPYVVHNKQLSNREYILIFNANCISATTLLRDIAIVYEKVTGILELRSV